MGRVSYVLLGVSIGLITSCAAVGYRYYGIEMPPECYDHSKLLGPKPKFDLSMTVCKPDDVMKGKCVVMLQDEFFRLIMAERTCQIDLKHCQNP